MSQIRHPPIAPTHTQQHVGGDRIDRHRHENHQLLYVSTGVLAIRTEHGAWAAARDRAVWVPARVWHENRFYGTTSLHTIGFPVGLPPVRGTTPCVVAVDPLLRELLIAYTNGAVSPGESKRILAVLRDRLGRAELDPLELPTARDPRLSRACELVEADLSQPRALPWLAREVNTSERVLTRLFRTEFGMTYPQWRTNVRIFHAMVLLTEGATVTESAHACGWATTSAFIDTFVRAMGQTPGTFRSPSSR